MRKFIERMRAAEEKGHREGDVNVRHDHLAHKNKGPARTGRNIAPVAPADAPVAAPGAGATR